MFLFSLTLYPLILLQRTLANQILWKVYLLPEDDPNKKSDQYIEKWGHGTG
jgi:hypothetical protein